jgi:hypothetical protein
MLAVVRGKEEIRKGEREKKNRGRRGIILRIYTNTLIQTRFAAFNMSTKSGFVQRSLTC